MNKKLLCILTTYNRPQKLLRFLNQFDEKFNNVSDFFEIYVADDSSDSEIQDEVRDIINKSQIKISYHRNKSNLGQGPNLVQAIKVNAHYEYYWFPGDDDLIIPDEFNKFLLNLKESNPSVAVFEFRQGKGLKSGTFLEGRNRIEKDPSVIIDSILKFGKCTSTVVGNPGEKFIQFLEIYMRNCMYQDKALVLYTFLISKKRNAYIHTDLTATGDAEYGNLRYSTRVFSNLDKTASKVINYYNDNNANKYHHIFNKPISPLYWWYFGIKCNILFWKSEIRYKNVKFIKELFLGLFVAIYYEYIKDDFQPK
jgi:hypothetical protein